LRPFDVILADPPWWYADRRDKHTRFCGGARTYYDVISTKDLATLPVQDICAENAMLFLWATIPHLAHAPYDWSALERELGVTWMELDKLLKVSDVVSLHVPGTAETQRLIGERELGLMKQGVILVNMARGMVMDEAALIRTLKSGKIRVAALDVFEKEPISPDNPLMKMDNVILTPHLGACNLEGMQRMAVQVAEAVGLKISGLDILPRSDGEPIVLEANCFPGYKALMETTGIQIYKLIVDYFVSLAA